MRQPFGLVSIFATANLVARGLAQTTHHTTCFRIDGSILTDVYRCNNHTTGHSSCCAVGEECWSNGVCHNGASGIEDWLREGCTDYTWNDPACAKICTNYNGPPKVGVRPCGGIDKSNVYCCDDGSTGIGSFACCNNESDTFTYGDMDSLPTVIATLRPNDISTSSLIIPSTSTRTTQTETTHTNAITTNTNTMSTSIDTTTPTESAEHEDSNSSSSISTGLGAGLGVGLPVAAAIIGGIWWAIRRSRQKQTSGSEKGSQQNVSSYTSTTGDYTSPSPFSTQYKYTSRTPQPTELSSGYEEIELPASPRAPSSGRGNAHEI